MCKRTYLLIALLAATLCAKSLAQQVATIPVTDSLAANVNGLQMGYTILSAKEKEVGNKGNFGRYSLRFFVTNTTGEAKILMYKQGFSIGDLSPQAARFDILNATGARLTNKQVWLNLPAANVLANVEDKDASGKIVTNKRFVQIGYWLKGGETVHTDAIVIVPLDELPNVVVAPLFNTNQLVGNGYGAPVPAEVAPPSPFFSPSQGSIQGFIKLKNLWKNTYLNNEKGPAVCTAITDGWWSAQWQILPVNGTNFYLVKNRWKETYISTEDPNSMLSINPQSRASLWIVEPVDQQTVRFRNVANNTYLNIEPGRLQSTQIQPGAWSSEWVIEPQQ